MPSAYVDDLLLAQRLADAADEVTMRRFLARDLHVETKPDLTPVSDADRAVEEGLRSLLAVERSGDAVLGEEYGADESLRGRRWILDPIDGTKNFIRGVPVWCTLIALADDDEVVVGVVSAPALRRRWWACRGEGAWTGAADEEPRRLRVSGVQDLADASLSFSDEQGWGARSEAFANLRTQVWRTRGYGDFWSHVLVAEGAVDIAVEPELSVWDIAALVPVVQEAGGTITGLDGAPALTAGAALTTNGLLHPEVVDALRP